MYQTYFRRRLRQWASSKRSLRHLDLDKLLWAGESGPLTSASRTLCYGKFWLCFTPYEGLLAPGLEFSASQSSYSPPSVVPRRFSAPELYWCRALPV